MTLMTLSSFCCILIFNWFMWVLTAFEVTSSIQILCWKYDIRSDICCNLWLKWFTFIEDRCITYMDVKPMCMHIMSVPWMHLCVGNSYKTLWVRVRGKLFYQYRQEKSNTILYTTILSHYGAFQDCYNHSSLILQCVPYYGCSMMLLDMIHTTDYNPARSITPSGSGVWGSRYSNSTTLD